MIDRVIIDYTNWKGTRRVRTIQPINLFFGCDEWHKEPQWLLEALDIESNEHRTFAIKDIHSWKPALI